MNSNLLPDFLPFNSLYELRRCNREIGQLALIIFDSIAFDKVLHPEAVSHNLIVLLNNWGRSAPGATADQLVKIIFELERCGALSYGEADFLISQICFLENAKVMYRPKKARLAAG